MLCAGNQYFQIYRLWFDVGFKRYTTDFVLNQIAMPLWFDVGFKRYTTFWRGKQRPLELWFDVGFKRYTTNLTLLIWYYSCGLM